MAARAFEKALSRSLKIEREKIDEDKRTIEVAFSSETPVERWGENEVLSHEKGDYDFARLNDSHPLLLGHNEHDPDSQIGVIESARVDKDKIGRAIVRFGNSAKASEIFKDVIEGIRSLISVGYDRTGIVKSDKAKDGRVTTRYKWEPTHIAIVPVPADTKVGVGRSKKRLCPDCEGTGSCPDCDGDGKDEDEEGGRCMRCGGSGRCGDCRGNGYITTAKSKSAVDSLEKLNVEQISSALTPEQKNQMRIQLDKETPGGNGITTAELDAKLAEGRTAEKTSLKLRIKEIEAIADVLIKDHGKRDGGKMEAKIRGMVSEAFQKDEAIDAFKLRCLTDVLAAKPAEPMLLEHFTDEPNRYCMLRGIQSSLRRKISGKEAIPDGLEGEVHQGIIQRAKELGGLPPEAAGFQVPCNARSPVTGASRMRISRDQQVDVFGAGGAAVPTMLMLPVIELLRNEIVLSKCGMRTLGGLSGMVVIPRQTAPTTAYSVSEIGLLTASQLTLDQIALSPKRVGNTVPYSKQLVLQSSPDIEALIRDDMFEVIALKWDELGLNGQGAASEPLGIFNTPGIGSVTFGATPTYIKMIAFETAIRSQNVRGPIHYASTPTVKGTLKGVAEALTGATTIGGSQNAIWKGRGEEMGEINGYPAIDSNQIPNNYVLAGVFDNLIHALWGGIDIVVDYYTKAANAEVVLTFNTWGDFAVRHPQAFCVSSDTANQ